ncbi:MAG: hypothetical protein ACYC35_11085 [Pirellulales bacterium]
MIWTLAVANIPVYLFIGWLAFDTKQGAASTFFDTIVAVLKIILIPRIVRALLGMDDSDALGLFPIAGFFLACGAIVYGEYYLIGQWMGA